MGMQPEDNLSSLEKETKIGLDFEADKKLFKMLFSFRKHSSVSRIIFSFFVGLQFVLLVGAEIEIEGEAIVLFLIIALTAFYISKWGTPYSLKNYPCKKAIMLSISLFTASYYGFTVSGADYPFRSSLLANTPLFLFWVWARLFHADGGK